MSTKRVVLKNLDEETATRIIQKFIDAGWAYTKISEHGEGYILRFDWVKDSPEVLPEGYQD